MICAIPFLMLLPVLPGMGPTADEIVCRVAENQQRAEAARSAYVYDMNVFVRMQHSNGKLAREETREYVVAPTPRGAGRKLVKLSGRIQDGKKEILYSEAKYHHKKVDVDGNLTDAFANDVMWKKGDSGPTLGWFPLTQDRLKHWTFELKGEERYRDYDVYKLEWASHGPEPGKDEDDCWTGEALIEKHEFQPVLLTMAWNCKIPGAVKVLLGTNVTQLGAKISYQRFAKDVWFPVNCGGEVKWRVLFLYARTVAFTARNSGFRKTDVQSSIGFETSN
jgi:hypothetical protein